MDKTRINALLWINFTILLGLASRAITFVPLWIGDALYGILIFFMVKFIHVKKTNRTVAAMSLLLCYLIEFSQLYQAQWIKQIRRTIPGKLILGQGFLWSDLLAYTVGILAVYWILTSRKNIRA
ncbi:DUF2809 domain-containing protein [Gottschalkiaceae bacterium SANA]|nr:DUF2809 domain-containing protein [Gottschalkiaceae bacterium SANA]